MSKNRVLVVAGDKERADILCQRLAEDFDIVNASPSELFSPWLTAKHIDLMVGELCVESEPPVPGEIFGQCMAMHTLFAGMKNIQRTDSDLILFGESGVGKRLVAQGIHAQSGRVGDFICVDLRPLSSEELEKTLLKIHWPEDGTLYLCGLERASMALQHRVLKQYLCILKESISGHKKRPHWICSVRGIKTAPPKMAAGLLEYFGSSMVQVPALRDRGQDIRTLAMQFLEQACKVKERKDISIGRQAMAELCAYHWPGNVRELAAVMTEVLERTADHCEIGPGVLASKGNRLVVEQVIGDVIGGGKGLDFAMAELEGAVIREALKQQKGNRSATARQLKLPRQTLQDRMKKHGLW